MQTVAASQTSLGSQSLIIHRVFRELTLNNSYSIYDGSGKVGPLISYSILCWFLNIQIIAVSSKKEILIECLAQYSNHDRKSENIFQSLRREFVCKWMFSKTFRRVDSLEFTALIYAARSP